MKTWNELTEWEQTKYAVRLIREVLGLSDAKLEHSYLGDDTPFDSGLINWQYIKDEQQKKLEKKKKRGKKKDEPDTIR